LGGDTSAQLRYVLQKAEFLNNTKSLSEIPLENLNLKELIGVSSEYLTYEGEKQSVFNKILDFDAFSGSLTWPGCFESVTWIIFNQYQQVLSTFFQTLFPNVLRFANNRQMLNLGTSVGRNVRTNIGTQQWFRSSSTSDTCHPMNNILQYHSKIESNRIESKRV